MIIKKIDEYLNEAKFTDKNAMNVTVAALLAASNFGMDLKLVAGDYVKIEYDKIRLSKISKNSLAQAFYSWSETDDNAFDEEYKDWLKTVKKDGIEKVLTYVSQNAKEIIERLVEKG